MKKNSRTKEIKGDDSTRPAEKPLGIAYLIGRLDHALKRQLRDAIAPVGLTVTQYTALSALTGHSQLSNAQLAERSLVSPQAANEMVKMMEEKGWIERQPDPAHGRIIRIHVTALGHELLGRCDNAVTQLESRMLAPLSEKDRTALRGQLRTLLHALHVTSLEASQY
ncbi:MarR family transcriptional regulator [Denitratisoma sp. agr-D3]